MEIADTVIQSHFVIECTAIRKDFPHCPYNQAVALSVLCTYPSQLKRQCSQVVVVVALVLHSPHEQLPCRYY